MTEFLCTLSAVTVACPPDYASPLLFPICVARGRSIAHIDRFAPVTTSRVRLNILSSSDPVHIREFQLSNTGKGAAAAR